jgi:hypothetical protein
MDDAQYEDRLGDALEKLLDEGADDLEALATGLNGLGVTSQSGEAWTAATLAAELKRLS